MREQLSWQQALILDAASHVDSLPFGAQFTINIPYGVWRSLVIRGLLRPTFAKDGWEITLDGVEAIRKRRRFSQHNLAVSNTERKTHER